MLKKKKHFKTAVEHHVSFREIRQNDTRSQLYTTVPADIGLYWKLASIA